MSGTTAAENRDAVFEVEFVVRDPSYPFVGASAEEGCAFELARMLPRRDDRYAEFFDVTGVDADRIVTRGRDHDSVDVTLLTAYESGGLFEFLVTDDCPAVELARLGALPREVQGVEGEGRIVAEIPARYDPPTVVEAFLEDTPAAELTTKREKERVEPLFPPAAFRHVLRNHLTDRQREVARAAFEAGYYDWPRSCTGEDVAAELGISSATFSEHIHAAERTLLTVLFCDSRTDRPGDR
ncbi:helix-turn-helix domain-containing protein [Haloplanus salilacus]|uniref:helix-turn-helix domain-containing protein n=1 Tax=Haloplanus salilacus TaxID=2949994 RepID=UPI0030D27AAE